MSLPQLFDYKQAIYSLLPRGACWPAVGGDSPVFDALIDAVSHEFARVHQTAEDLLDAFLPDTADTLLPDWERLLGLTAEGLTDAQRRAQIIAKLRKQQDPTLANLQAAADEWGLGAVVEHRVWDMFRVGVGVVGNRLYGEVWLYAIQVTYPGPGVQAFEDALRALLQAHNSIVFVYT